MLESKEVNPELDCVIIDCPFVNKIHKEICEQADSMEHYPEIAFSSAITHVAAKYGAEAYSKKGTSWYMFRFKSEKDKLAFILKNV